MPLESYFPLIVCDDMLFTQFIIVQNSATILKNRKRDAYINNRVFNEKIDDEYAFVDNQEEKLCDRFKSYTDARGMQYDFAYQFEMQNGYTNNYYYKYFLYGHNEIMKKVRKKKLYTLDYKEPSYSVFKVSVKLLLQYDVFYQT